MKARVVLFAAVLAAMPALAEDVSFKGRTLDVAADQEARPILRMLGSRYTLPRTQAQLFERGKACLGGQSGVAIASEDAVLGTVGADVKITFDAGFSDRLLRSRLTLEIGEGYFQLTESDLAQSRIDEDSGELFMPLSQEDDVWEDALEALVDRENGWIDCLYK